MNGSTLVGKLAAWVGATLNDPQTSGHEHCFQVRPQFRIPGAGRVDLLTVRHDTGRSDRFRVDLWVIQPRTVEAEDIDGMLRRIHAFEAWYTELMEHAETQGFSPRHRISVCGNLVGRSIRRSPLVDLLSHWGTALFFWTWKRAGLGIDVAPAYDRPPALKAARTQLKGLLDHLPWEDCADRDEPVAKPTKTSR